MSNYNSTRQMVASDSLRKRVSAAAAGENIVMPEVWTQENMWFLASNTEWVEAWTYATDTYTLDANPDTGARPGVINDGMILSVVQARIAYLKSLNETPAEESTP